MPVVTIDALTLVFLAKQQPTAMVCAWNGNNLPSQGRCAACLHKLLQGSDIRAVVSHITAYTDEAMFNRRCFNCGTQLKPANLGAQS